MRWLLAFIVITITSIGLSSCASSKPAPLAQLGYVNAATLPNTDSSINPIRLQALQETAATLGTRGALAWQAVHINEALEKQSLFLDHAFNFNQLLLQHNVLPPVIATSQDDLNLDDNDTIRMTDKTYRIISKARFVTVPPTWRDYLWLNFKKPDVPDKTLLPVSQAEANVWNSRLKVGWKQGMEQANAIFSENLSRLKRDYNGMVLFNQLLAQHIISAPDIAKANLGITGDSTHLRINDQVMRITNHSALQPNSTKWQPVITAPR